MLNKKEVAELPKGLTINPTLGRKFRRGLQRNKLFVSIVGGKFMGLLPTPKMNCRKLNASRKHRAAELHIHSFVVTKKEE